MIAFPRAVARFGGATIQGAARPGRATVRWAETPGRRRLVRLWIPATALAWLLSPLPLMLAPLAWLAPPPLRPRNPYAAALAIGGLLTSIGGTIVQVDTPDARIRIRIF